MKSHLYRLLYLAIFFLPLVLFSSCHDGADGSGIVAVTDNATNDTVDDTEDDIADDIPEEAAEVLLNQAGYFLKGQPKNLDEAKRILLRLAEHRADELDLRDRCHMYAYLGYIEDLNGNREAAKKQFEKGAALDGPDIGSIRDLVQSGLDKPITWIRHLDKGYSLKGAKDWKNSIIEQEGDFIIVRETTASRKMALKKNLTKAQRQDNFIKLWDAIDRYYCFFLVKNIDWAGVKKTYQDNLNALEAAGLGDRKSTQEFYPLMEQMVDELRDGHSWIENWWLFTHDRKADPSLLVGRVEGKAVVLRIGKDSDAEQQGLVPGSVIVEVDGKTVAERIAEIRKTQIPAYQDTALLDDAYRDLLEGEVGAKVRIKFLAPSDDEPREAQLSRERGPRIISFPPSFPVTEGQFTIYGKHPSGYGYIRILNFKGRDELADEFLQALKRLKKTPGLVIDIRDNTGGWGTSHRKIIGPLITLPKTPIRSFRKNGPGHGDFKVYKSHLFPSLRNRFSKPVALLLNSLTGSASDLFAARIIGAGRVVSLGQTTRGNTAGKCVSVYLPCGLEVRVSSGYVADRQGRAIEGRGKEPDIPIEPTIDDIAHGRDPVLEAAIKELEKRSK